MQRKHGGAALPASERPHARAADATLTVDFFTSLDDNGSARGWTGYWGKEGPELVAARADLQRALSGFEALKAETEAAATRALLR